MVSTSAWHAGDLGSIPGPGRGRPWRYSVIPSTPDILTEYQIRRNSNPAGLTVFAAIWGPDLRASTIILTHMFKQIYNKLELRWWWCSKSIPVNQMKYANDVYAMRGSDTGDCGIVYSPRGFSWLLPRIVWSLKVRLPMSLTHLLIAKKSAVGFPTDLTLAGHHVWKTQASEMTFCSLVFVCKMCRPPLGDPLKFSVIVAHRWRHLHNIASKYVF